MDRKVEAMYAHSKADQHFSSHVAPTCIVIGYVLSLFAVVAGVVAFPFSTLWVGLLCFLIGAFFVVAIPIILMTCVLMTIVICRAITRLGRRLIYGSRQDSDLPTMVEQLTFQKNLEPEGTDDTLWDQWIDGLR
jgi:hypothetical protein